MPEHPAGSPTGLPRLEPLKTVQAGALDVAYYEAGPGDSAVVVLLLHGYPMTSTATST